jgi:hypothetical protein
MKMNRSQVYIVLIAVLTLAIGLVTNIASSQLPESYKPRLWYAWPILGLLAALFIIVTVSSSRENSENKNTTRVSGPEFSLTHYYNALKRRYQTLDLDALTPPQKEEYLQLQLRSVFVEQNVRENYPPIELPKEILEKLQSEGEIRSEDLPEGLTADEIRASGQMYYEEHPRPVLRILAQSQHKHIVILGDPGAGKSTLARYVMLSLIDDEKIVASLKQIEGHLPLLIELRTFNALREEQKCDTFLEFLEFLGKTEGWHLTQVALHAHLKEKGNALVIFDGLDEVFDPKDRERVTHLIAGFIADYPQVRAIVTSRVIGYQRRILTDAGFAHFTLQDLEKAQVTTFITQWYRLALPNRPDEADSRRKRIMASFEQSSSIRQLAGNPMLLTIMAIIGKHQELPRERWKLYDHAAGVLIEHWDVKRHLENLNVDAPFMGEDDKKELLRRLAFRMQKGSGGLKGNYIHRDHLQTEFEAYLIERFGLSSDRAATISKLMIEQFRQRNFILSLYGANVYGFVHRAFLEYFCATAFVYRFEKSREMTPEQMNRDVFGSHWPDESWHEVLRLISGMVDERFAAGIISYLSTEAYPTWPEKLLDSPPWNLSLAVHCLGEIRSSSLVGYASHELLTRIISCLAHGMVNELRFDDFINEHILRPARSIGRNWPHREALSELLFMPERFGDGKYAWYYADNFASFVVAIGGDLDSIHKVVKGYASSDNDNRRVLGLATLAEGWAQASDTVGLLLKGCGDANADIRWVAIRALSEFFTESQAFPILMQHAVNDPDMAVRRASLSNLRVRFGYRPEISTMARDRAVKETEKGPRREAMGILASFSRKDDEALAVLRTIATNDPEEEWREYAKSLIE